MKRILSSSWLLLTFALLLISSAGAAPLRAGYLASTGAPLASLAQDANLFKKEKVNVRLVPFASTPDGLNALNSGKIDVAVTFGTAAPLTFISKNADFVIIGGHLTGGHSIAAKPSVAARFHSNKNFRGLTIATPRMYTADIIFRGALIKTGLSIGDQVKLIEVKNGPASLEALKSGKVDAAVLVYGDQVEAERAGFKLLRWSNDLFPNHPCCRLVVKRDLIKRHPKDLVAFLKAMIQAERIKDSDPNRFVHAWAKDQNTDLRRAREILLEPHLQFSVDPNTTGVKRMWNYMKSVGYIHSNIDIRQRIDVALYKKALDDLSRKSPNDKFYKKLEQRFARQNPVRDRVACHEDSHKPKLVARLNQVAECCR